MPRRPSNYPRIMELGRWLSDFITTPPAYFNTRDRVGDALRIMNVDHAVTDDDPVITALEYAYGHPEIFEMYFMPKLEPDYGVLGINTERYSTHELRSIHMEVYGTLSAPDTLRYLAWKIGSEDGKSWEYVLSTPKHENPLPGSLASIPDDDLTRLLNMCNRIREKLIIEDRKIRIVNRFVRPGNEGAFDLDCNWVRVSALISRMFVEFLKIGGDEYCGVCKDCSKFILAERKGQRQFCGGRCRIAQKRKLDSVRQVIRETKKRNQ